MQANDKSVSSSKEYVFLSADIIIPFIDAGIPLFSPKSSFACHL